MITQILNFRTKILSPSLVDISGASFFIIQGVTRLILTLYCLLKNYVGCLDGFSGLFYGLLNDIVTFVYILPILYFFNSLSTLFII